MLINGWRSSFSDSVLRQRSVLSRLSSFGRGARTRRQPRPFAQQCLVAQHLESLEDRLLLAATNPLPLDSLDGTNGFRLDGVNSGDEAGRSVSSAGDVNGDGFDDVLIGPLGANGGDT